MTPAAGLSRQQGTAASNSTIATVNDQDNSPGSLTVTATTVPAGMTISNIVNTNGTITADIAAGCALFYLDFRFAHIDWRGDHSNLARLADKLAVRKSFVDTVPT